MAWALMHLLASNAKPKRTQLCSYPTARHRVCSCRGCELRWARASWLKLRLPLHVSLHFGRTFLTACPWVWAARQWCTCTGTHSSFSRSAAREGPCTLPVLCPHGTSASLFYLFPDVLCLFWWFKWPQGCPLSTTVCITIHNIMRNHRMHTKFL